jgi:polyisoprenoid-binding protein YceI
MRLDTTMKRGINAARPVWLLALVILAAAPAGPQAQRAGNATVSNAITLSMDPARSDVHWTLGSTLHTVHGTFALKRGEIRVDPATGDASGEFVADATSGKSGNDSRDAKMHKEILESGKYSDVIFRPTKVEGKVLIQGASNVQVHGTFLLHGSEHELTVPVQAELVGTQWKGSAKFTIPYVQWGLKSPNTFLLKADPAVEIELELNGTLQAAAAQ